MNDWATLTPAGVLSTADGGGAETMRAPDLSEGSQSAQRLLSLLVHPLLPPLLLLLLLLSLLQTTEGDSESF